MLPFRCVLTVTYIPLVLLFDRPEPVKDHFILKPTAYGIVWITVLATLGVGGAHQNKAARVLGGGSP